MKIIAFEPIGLGFGTRENHHWNAPKLSILFDNLKHFIPVHTGQIEVEKNEIYRLGIFMRVSAIEIVQGIFTVVYY